MMALVLGLTAVLFSSTAIAAAPEPGLVAHYALDEGSGIALHDRSPMKNDGKVIGAAWVKGKKGAALDFDGRGDCVDCGDDPAGRLVGPLTVSLWVRRASDVQQYVVNRGGWNIYLLPDGRPVFETRTAANDAWDSLFVATRIPPDEWAFVAAVYDTDRQCMEIFVNGKLAGSKPRKDGSIGGLFRSKLILGRQLNGLMGEFRLYRRALSAEEIQQLYAAGTPDRTLAPPQYRLRLKPHLFFASRKIVAAVYLCETGKRPDAGTAEVALFGAGGSKPIQRESIDNLTAVKKAEVTFSLAGLPPGDYEVRASAKTPEGKTFAKISVPVKFPKKPWWFGSEVGIEDEVFAPWTPLKVAGRKGDAPPGAPSFGLDVICWGRTYGFTPLSFLERVVTGGRHILAEPIRFTGQADGGDIKWKPTQFRMEKETPTKIVLSQRATAGKLELNAKTVIEYDGLIRVDCDIVPRQSVKIERLALEIPLRQEHARLVYQYRDALYKVPGRLPKGGIVRNFNPAIWIGDEERGLQWFTESDEDWHLADPNRAIEIVRDGQEVILRLNLVTTPIELKPHAVRTIRSAPHLSYTFGLQATPVKPVAKDAWDLRITSAHRYGADYAMATDQIAGKSVLDHYAERGVRTIFLGNWTDVLSYPAPIGHAEQLRSLVKACHERNMQVLVYLGNQYSELAPEFSTFFQDFAAWTSGKPYSHYGYVDNYPPMPAQQAYVPCIGSEWRDLIVAGAARLMDEFDVDGFYLDGVGLGGACHNLHHGCGYVHPDGTLRPTYSFFAGRDAIRRLYQIVKSRKPEGQIDLHPAACWVSPVMAWATNVWDGETLLGEKLRGVSPPKGTFMLDYMPLDMFRTQYMGRPWGVSAEFLSYYLPHSYGQVFTMTLLHDVLVRPNNPHDGLRFVSSLWRLSDEFGRKEAEWLPYWKNSEYVKAGPEGAYVSLYRHPKNGVLAVVSNLGRKKTAVKVSFALDKLGLSRKSTACDALTKEAIPFDNGSIVLELDSVAWRLVWIRP